MQSLLAELRGRLGELEAQGLSRSLRAPRGIDFSSNDYLGLAASPALRSRLLRALESCPLGAPASRLLRGHLPEHAEVEARLAELKGTEAALLFPSGYQANVALLTALLRPGDLAFSDALNHASIIDGLRLSGATKRIYSHGSAVEAARLLAEATGNSRRVLVTESYFSVDGDVAPLVELAHAARAGNAALIVDDAHALGVFGNRRSSGLVEEAGIESQVLATVSTCGKALGLWGAFVAGPRVLVDFLVNTSRPFIFTTATSPILAAGIHAALDLIAEEPWRREKVLELSALLRRRLVAAGLAVPAGVGPIVPVLVGDNRRAVEVAAAIQEAGYDVRAVRPPTVPDGTARLRISVHANHEVEQIEGLARVTSEALASRGRA